MSKAIIYLRVSTEEQAEKGFSLLAQREECVTKLKTLNCYEIQEFCDEGVSGSILERPMLLSAMELMKQQTFDFFICYDPSRLSRNVTHQLILIDNIKKLGTKLIFVRSNYEDTAEGRFQLTIMAAVDEYERARLKIRTELGKRAKANQKLLTHNPNIYGYTFDKENDTLRINEEQAHIVRKIFDMLIQEKLGPSKITEKLNEMGIRSMRGKQWSRVSINRLLKNFSYTGTLFIRRYDTKEYKLNKFKKEKEKVRIIEKPRDQWISIEIPAIIEESKWHQAKIILEKSNRIYKLHSNKNYILSGMLRCGLCGGTFYGRTITKDEMQTKYYCCSNKYNYQIPIDHRCSSKLYKANNLDEAVWQKAKSWLLNENELQKLMDSVYINEANIIRDNKYIEQMIDQASKEKEKVLLLFQKSYINEQELNEKINQIIKRVEMLNKELHNKPLFGKTFYNEPSNLIDQVTLYIESISDGQKNAILQRLIKEIVIKDNIVIVKALLPKHIINEV